MRGKMISWDVQQSVTIMFFLMAAAVFVCQVSGAPLGAIRQRIEDNVQNIETGYLTGLDGRPDFLSKAVDPDLQSAEVYAPRINKQSELNINTSPEKLLEEFMSYGKRNETTEEDSYKLGYSVDDGRMKRFRYEEKTPEGVIVGEFGFHKGDGVIRGVKYTAEAGVHPKVLYEALVKFLSL